MIRGFLAQLGTTTVTTKWVPAGAPVNIYRSRVALRIPPPPWNLEDGDILDVLVPKVSGSGETIKRIQFTGALPETAQQLVDYINGQQIGNVEARLDYGGGVSIHVIATMPFIQVCSRSTTVMAKFSLHTEVVTKNSHWDLLATIDPIVGDRPEYETFVDSFGVSSDYYRARDTSDDLLTPPTVPVAASWPMATIEGTLRSMDGSAAQMVTVLAHAVPPSEPDVAGSDTPLQPPGWPVNILRPMDSIPTFGADTTAPTNALRGKLWYYALTDTNGFFSIPCARGQRVWLEISELGWSAIIDVPNAPYVDIATLSSWRRTGMAGPLD
jgi:hypothetical protein